MVRGFARVLPLVVAGLMAVGDPSPVDAAATTPRERGVATLKARARENGSVRVIVELRIDPHAGRRAHREVQRRVVTRALGDAAWRARDAGDAHAVSPMWPSPMVAAAVTAAEIDRLAADPLVKRIVADAPDPPLSVAPDRP